MRYYKNFLESKQEEEEIPFGFLATYDIYNATGPLMFNSNKSKKAIEKFLVALVKELKMTVASPPVCYMSDKKEQETMKNVGASSYISLEQSGLMLHTITNKTPKFACIDVFSCKKFDPKLIDAFLKKQFQTKDIIMKFIKRGTKY